MNNDHPKVHRGLRPSGTRLAGTALLLALLLGVLLNACTPQNAAPTALTLDDASVAENQPAGTTVGTFATTDADAGDSHTYTLVSGDGDDDNASFAIAGDELRTAEVFDFETEDSYSVRVETSDGKGGAFARAFAIAVTDVNETTTLEGSVTSLRLDMGINGAAPGLHFADLGVEGLNRLIESHRAADAAGALPPVRGLNAAWLRFLPQQAAPDSLLAGQLVVAVADDGEVLAQGPIAADGSFALDVPRDRQLALFQARENGTLLCNRVMGYMQLDGTGKTVHWRGAFFEIDDEGAPAPAPEQVDVGDFSFSEHNASLGGGWSQYPSDLGTTAPGGDYGSCDNPAQVRAPVAANFDLAVPVGFDEATLYDFALALALEYDAEGNPTFLGSGKLGAGGSVVAMDVSKIEGEDLPMTLVLVDAGAFLPSKANYPLTPTAMIGGPGQVSTLLDDDGHDFGSVSGGVARLRGTVYVAGVPTAGVEVVGILDSSDTLAFNWAVTEADGSYDLLLPVDADEDYSIVATDPATGWSDSPCSPCSVTSADETTLDIWVYDPDSPAARGAE